MGENYEYSRKRLAETSEDVRFASNRRRFLYVAGGIIFVVCAWFLSNRASAMSSDELRGHIFDWLFIAACIPIVGWFGIRVHKVLNVKVDHKNSGS